MAYPIKKMAANNRAVPPSASYFSRLRKNIKTYYQLYILIIPVLAYYIIFHYGPMYGAQIAFRNFTPADGIFQSPWVGLTHFKTYFNNHFFWRLIRNTVMINVYDVIFGFIAPIILALLINELRSQRYKRVVQTITYIPHFVSIVVICGLIKDMLSSRGLINYMLAFFFNMEPHNYLLDPSYFRGIYVSSGIWQEAGWGSIIYLAAIMAIDPELYEAAIIDGAGRFRRVLNITIPCIAPTIITLLIMRLGRMMNVGAEKVLLLYNPATYDVSDVISTYVYRKGLFEMNYSYGAAVGLLNSVINFTLLIIANAVSKRTSETSLW